MSKVAPSAGDGLLSLWPLLSIVVLLCNDHWWKAASPGFITGKISDFAGLFFFPLLLQALTEYGLALFGRFKQPSNQLLLAACLFTALFFTAMKLSPFAGEMYRVGLAALQWPFRALHAWMNGAQTPLLAKVSLVQDETDLISLPMIALSYWFGIRRTRAAIGDVRGQQ